MAADSPDDDDYYDDDELPPYTTGEILRHGIGTHLAHRRHLQALPHVSLSDPAIDPARVVCPDVVVVKPMASLADDVQAYRIGEDGPAPLLIVEILSSPYPAQIDLSAQTEFYSRLGVAECVLVDLSGVFMPDRMRLFMRRLGPDGAWHDGRDHDGGVTSDLGFRIVIEDDGQVRVVDCATGRRYLRPDEADLRLNNFDIQMAWLKETLPLLDGDADRERWARGD